MKAALSPEGQAHLNGKGSKDDECDGGWVRARGVAQQCHPEPSRGLVEEQTPDAATHAPPTGKHKEQLVSMLTHSFRQVLNGWSTEMVAGPQECMQLELCCRAKC